MSKPGKVLKGLCKKLGVRLTVKRGKKRVYKSVKVLKAQCSKKKKKKVKRKRRKTSFGKNRDIEAVKNTECKKIKGCNGNPRCCKRVKKALINMYQGKATKADKKLIVDKKHFIKSDVDLINHCWNPKNKLKCRVLLGAGLGAGVGASMYAIKKTYDSYSPKGPYNFGKLTKKQINDITIQDLQNDTELKLLKELKNYALTGEQYSRDIKKLAGLSVGATVLGVGYRGYKQYKNNKRKKKKKAKKKKKKKKKKVRRKRRFGQTRRVRIKVSVLPVVRFADMAGQDPNDGYYIISKEDLKEENSNFDPNSGHRIAVDGDKLKHVHNLNITDNTVGEYQHGRGYVAVTYNQYEVTHDNPEETIKWTPTSGTFDPNSWSSDYWFVTIH